MRLFPIASDAWRFVVPLAAVGGLLVFVESYAARLLSGFLFLAAGFCLFFFRDFNRLTPKDDAAIYSPGDGKILAVETLDGERAGWKRIRIFLSVFDGHVQRSPVQGRVQKIHYQKGLFLDARNPEAHMRNEQNEMTILTPEGPVVVTQIAGLIARRIVCWTKVGQTLEQGERYGLIRFGSQVDVLLPPGVQIVIAEGEKAVGGKTVIARWRT